MQHFALFMLTLLSFGLAAADGRIVAVEGSGVIEVVPDIIRVSYSVSKISDSNASSAKSIVDDVAALSIGSLIELGVEKGDFSSSSLTVQPYEEYDENNNVSRTRYMVSRRIEATLKDVELYNSAIQALVDSGVTEISSVSPDVSNYEDLKRQAIVAAAKDAKSSAAFLASELGAKLGEVRQIGKQQLRRQFSLKEIVVTARKRTSSEGIVYEFEPGTVQVSAVLYVEFELK